MRTRQLIAVTLTATAGALVFAGFLATPAQAKGALSATITGPGLGAPLRLEPNDRTVILFNALASGTGADQLAFGEAKPAPSAPTRNLGPAYQVTYDFGRSVTLRLDAYPLAEGGPAISVPGGQRRPFDNAAIPGGWLRGDSGLARTMVRVGVPLQLPSPTPRATSAAAAAAPVPAATNTPRNAVLVVATVGLGTLILAALTLWRLRRRRLASAAR